MQRLETSRDVAVQLRVALQWCCPRKMQTPESSGIQRQDWLRDTMVERLFCANIHCIQAKHGETFYSIMHNILQVVQPRQTETCSFTLNIPKPGFLMFCFYLYIYQHLQQVTN